MIADNDNNILQGSTAALQLSNTIQQKFLIVEDQLTTGRDGITDDEQQRQQQQQLLLNQLRCPICFEICVPPIYQCRNGKHIICSDCFNQLVKSRKQEDSPPIVTSPKCPQCREDMRNPPHRNIFLEKKAKSCAVHCRHVGCTEKVLYPSLSTHLDTCAHRPVVCMERECDCTCSGWEKFWLHIQQKHSLCIDKQIRHYNEIITEYVNGRTLKMILERGDKVIWSSNLISTITQKLNTSGTTTSTTTSASTATTACANQITRFNNDTTTQRISSFICYVPSKETLYFGVRELGQRQMGIYYTLCVESIDCNTSLSLSSVKGISYRLDYDDIVTNKDNAMRECFALSSKLLTQVSSNFTKVVKFSVKPKIVKI